MARKVIQPKTLNDPRPRYSQGILNTGGKVLFIAGQTASDKDGNVVGKGDIEAQTRQVLTNLRHVLETADSGLNFVVKTTVFLQDMGDFAKMNAIYAEFFPENPPARSTVAAAGLPKGVSVEIEAVALVAPGRGD